VLPVLPSTPLHPPSRSKCAGTSKASDTHSAPRASVRRPSRASLAPHRSITSPVIAKSSARPASNVSLTPPKLNHPTLIRSGTRNSASPRTTGAALRAMSHATAGIESSAAAPMPVLCGTNSSRNSAPGPGQASASAGRRHSQACTTSPGGAATDSALGAAPADRASGASAASAARA
jgi:hypothetical protein